MSHRSSSPGSRRWSDPPDPQGLYRVGVLPLEKCAAKNLKLDLTLRGQSGPAEGRVNERAINSGRFFQTRLGRFDAGAWLLALHGRPSIAVTRTNLPLCTWD